MALSSGRCGHHRGSDWTHSDLRTRGRIGSMAISAGRNQAGETPVAALTREVLEEISLPRNAYSIGCVRGPYRYRFPAGITKKRVPRAGPLLFSPAFARVEEPGERGRAERRISFGALDSPRGVQSRVAAADETANLPSCASRFLRRQGENQGEFRLTRAHPQGMNRAEFLFVFVC